MTGNSRQSNRGTPEEILSPPDRDQRDDALLSLAQQCESNTEALQGMLQQVADIHHLLISAREASAEVAIADRNANEGESEPLRAEIQHLRSQVEDLEKQNSELASQLASRSVETSLGDDQSRSNETLSWEERKQLMLRQMEEDSFDAEAFVSSLNETESDETIDPIEYVRQMQDELDRRDVELEDRSQQIRELQHLLDSQSETRDGGLAIGAAAITEMFDADELVREERERLQQMQEEWEEKFRQAEIEASLERAKLSRERQELAAKMADLEEQLAHAKRESRSNSHDENGNSRRWLAKLGLAEGSA
tara:strand:+ start:69900 stop:70823 length:924 start_codon:yes stop_codon:yes gene_type:complete